MARWRREDAGPSDVPGELAVTVRRSTVQKSYHPRQQTVPRGKMDSSVGMHGIEETMAATPEDVMNGMWERCPEAEAKMIE